MASTVMRGERIPVYYVPADPAEFNDARLGPPGAFDLGAVEFIGAITLAGTVGVIVLPRYLLRRGFGRIA